MRRLSLLVSTVALSAWWTVAAAQEQFIRNSTILPSSQDGTSVERPGPEVRYRSFKTSEDNLDTQQVIAQKLREAQDALQALDRQRTQAAAAGDKIPLGGEDTERLKLVKIKDAWLQRKKRFTTESTCGSLDDSKDVELYQGDTPPQGFVQQQQPATALIRWKGNLDAILPEGIDRGEIEGMRWCTGTLISSNQLLTAGHCFDPNINNIRTPARIVDGHAVSLNPNEMAPLMQVEFNYQRDASKCANPAEPLTCPVRRPDVYPIVSLLEHRRNKLDYAIVVLGVGADGKPPGAHYSVLTPDASDATLAKADLLTIIQHPNGVPKRIASGVHLRLGPAVIYYSDVDTMGVSSGAAVLDRSGHIIGIHTTGGCDDPTKNYENSGVTLKAISQVSNVILP